MTILQALDGYYGRMAARGEVSSPGWSTEPVGFVITIDRDGSVVDVGTWRDASGKKPRPERVPKWFGRSGNGSTPFFLWDNTAYALGVSNKDPGKTARDHAAFRQLHAEALRDTCDPGLLALRRFLDTWKPQHFVAPLFDDKMLAWNVAFRLDGEQQLIHATPAASALIEQQRSRPPVQPAGKATAAGSENAGAVICLVTGAKVPGVRLHPKIKGVNGTAAAEVPLVSFNESAFESYGQEQGANAPTSEGAAFRYGAALNALLERGVSRNRLLRGIGDATVAFWADASGVVAGAAEAEAAATAAEELFAFLIDPAPAGDGGDDQAEAAKLRDALDAFAAGRPIKDVNPKLEQGTRFYVLGLAPNAARLSVRYWLADSFESFAAKLARHHGDLELEPRPRGWTKPPSISRLLVRTTALQEKFDNIPPLLAGEVTRAVLTGSTYPRTLLTAAITRLRAGDSPGSGWHAAVVKACLNRSAKHEKEKLPVALDPTHASPAYQLGRLFAVLESAQYAALGRVNAPIGDRYYGAASSTPARVFGALLRGLKTHVSDARKRGQGGWIEPKVAEIMSRLPPDLPRSLRVEDQGRFAVGYYHERATRAARSDGDATEGSDDHG